MKTVTLLFSWVILFLLQLFFNLSTPFDFWLRLLVLCGYMFLCSILWIRFVDRRSIIDRLGLSENSITVLTYASLAAILVFFTRGTFKGATLLTGGALIVPIFEELFFRSHLLGSLVGDWPSLEDLPRSERLRLLKISLLPLFATSIFFTLVHDDVITALLNLPIFDFSMILMMLLRILFAMAVGGLYLLKGKVILPVIFHISFNLSYFLMMD